MNRCQFRCACPAPMLTNQHQRGTGHRGALMQSLFNAFQAQVQLDASLLTGIATLLRNRTKVLLDRLELDNHQFEVELPVFHRTVYVIELKRTQGSPEPYGPHKPTCKRLPQQMQPILKTLTDGENEDSHALKSPLLQIRLCGEALPPPGLQSFGGTARLALGERNLSCDRGQDELTLVAFSNPPSFRFRLSKGQRRRSSAVCRMAKPKRHNPQENGGCNSEDRHSNSPCVPFRLASLPKEPARTECVEELHTPLPVKKGPDHATESKWRQGLTHPRPPYHQSLIPSYCHAAFPSLHSVGHRRSQRWVI